MASIKEQLGILLRVQDVDLEIYGLQRKLDSMPREIKRVDEELEKERNKIAEAEEHRKQLILRKKEREIDFEDKEGKIKKCQLELYKIRTNKEYSALVKEMEGMRANSSVAEEDLLNLMEDVDKATSSAAEQKRGLEESARRAAVMKKEIETEIKAIEERLATLKNQRNQIVPAVGKAVLSAYERILDSKDGFALAAARDGICQGCHVVLPAQVIDEVTMGKDLVTCERCSRLLYGAD